MIKSSLRKNVIVNCILVVLVLVVFSVSIFPESIAPIYKNMSTNPYYHGNTDRKNVSLMFNVYENADVVKKIVDKLHENNVVATFFVGGCWADDNINTLNYILKFGNEIGNHGYFHKDHGKLNYSENYDEINNNTKIVNALCGVKMSLFAPPSGSFSSSTLEVCENLDYNVIMWSKDTIDWRDSDTSVLYKRATNKPSNGDLVLMHPKAHTLSILDDVISFYKSNGYSLVTVSENIK